MATAEKKYTTDSIIGEVVKSSPGAKAIIEKHFGNGCFTCPGINVETIAFGSTMHNMNPEDILKELNELED